MSLIETTVLDIRRKTSNDNEFVQRINALIDKEGDSVCQIFFKLFADLELPPYTARKNWFDVVDHREELSLFMGRDIDIITVMSDYLSYSCQYMKNPMLVEFDTFEKALEDSRHDTLTGLLNRGCFWEILKSNLAQAKRHSTELTILFLDVDDFKLFNDSFGHQAGDKALASIANVIRQESRTGDVAIRYGGEEFVVIMPNTGEQNAMALSERIRKKIEGLVIAINGKELSLTISGGISSYPADADDGYVLLNMADRALYRAKAMGKNNISIFTDEKQRSYPRSKLVRPVKIKKIGVNSIYPLKGSSKNICMGGMLFETSHQLDVGSHIEVSIPIMDTEPLFLIGSVVRVEPEKKGLYDVGMSISFKEMERTARQQISGFLMAKQLGGKGGRRRRRSSNVTNILEM